MVPVFPNMLKGFLRETSRIFRGANISWILRRIAPQNDKDLISSQDFPP